MAGANATAPLDLPPLPAYTLRPLPSLVPGMSDQWLALVAPVVLYWALSMFFHLVDVYDVWPQYRLHTPEEITRRNHAGRWEVARDVVIQQLIQTITGYLLSLGEAPQMTGAEEYDTALWARRIRLAQRGLPALLGFVGLNAAAISKNMLPSHPLLAGALAGGYYPGLVAELDGSAGVTVPTFAAWELLVAKLIYWLVIPGLQFFGAVVVFDTWEYFIHRLMHVNKWLYTTVHSRHHRLYVPYAYGALYNHPLEAFLLDSVGAGLTYKLMGLSARQGVLFFCCCTVKTVDDHCGYALPWDPLQHITSNNAAYHDIHHQIWGIKTNFSQPFFTFWDKLLNTRYTGNKADKQRAEARAQAAKSQ